MQIPRRYPLRRKTLVIGALAILLFGCKGDGVTYRTEPITRGPLRETVTATGTVNAVTTVLVGTQVSGTIKKLFVDFNSRVKKGQIIAQIDPSTFEAQVQQARANLLAAQAGLEKAKAALVDAQRTYERNKDLFARNLVPRSDLDTAETNRDTDKAGVAAAKAQIEQTRAALAYAQQNLGYTKILSPVDGVVISRNVDVGQTVAASFQTPTLFTIAQDLTKMQIDTNVAEADIGVVTVGQDVEFTVDAYPDVTFRGKVWQIRKAPITVQNVVTYDVVIQVNNEDLKLLPGMTANVSIIVARRQDAIRIPNAALRFRMPEQHQAKGKNPAGEKRAHRGPMIWILEQGKPKGVPVELGISDGMNTEAVSGDLKEGEQAITDMSGAGNNRGGEQQRGPRMMF